VKQALQALALCHAWFGQWYCGQLGLHSVKEPGEAQHTDGIERRGSAVASRPISALAIGRGNVSDINPWQGYDSLSNVWALAVHDLFFSGPCDKRVN